MLVPAAKAALICFALFFFASGLLMLIRPVKARNILRKAGSTNLINYGEISLRMIPAAAFVIYAEQTLYPDLFRIIGWFMLFTSAVLLLVPRRLHHQFSVACADVLKPLYFQLISPFAFLFGAAILYSIWS